MVRRTEETGVCHTVFHFSFSFCSTGDVKVETWRWRHEGGDMRESTFMRKAGLTALDVGQSFILTLKAGNVPVVISRRILNWKPSSLLYFQHVIIAAFWPHVDGLSGSGLICQSNPHLLLCLVKEEDSAQLFLTFSRSWLVWWRSTK